jgi:hypothetical protein
MTASGWPAGLSSGSTQRMLAPAAVLKLVRGGPSALAECGCSI